MGFYLYREKIGIQDFTQQIGQGRREFDRCKIIERKTQPTTPYLIKELTEEDPIKLTKCIFFKTDLNGLYIPYTRGNDFGFFRASLTNIDLSEAKLEDIDIAESKINSLDLTSTRFKGRIYECNVVDANMGLSNLMGSKFYRTHFKNVNFTGANLSNTLFRGCKIENSSFIGAIGLESIEDIESCSLEGIIVSQKELEILEKRQPEKYKII